MNKINARKVLAEYEDDFIFNFLDIENYNSESSRLRFWFDHCKKNIDKLEGDIFEFGVFRGSSLISMALLLKKLGSKKKVFGFDSFGGFPEYHKHDDLNAFDLNPDFFEQTLIDKHKLMMDLKSIGNDSILPANVSSSGEFNDTSEAYVRKKIKELKLDNIELVVGDFANTAPKFFSKYKGKIFSCNLDCDLYLGYKNTLPYTYDRLVRGGYVHLDEYYSLKFPGARIACIEYFNKEGIKPKKQLVPSYEFERWYLEK